MKNEKLPIGTVIRINGRNQKYIIVGKNIKVNDITYDYMCAIYPYGMTDDKECTYFNDTEVKSICHLGDINY